MRSDRQRTFSLVNGHIIEAHCKGWVYSYNNKSVIHSLRAKSSPHYQWIKFSFMVFGSHKLIILRKCAFEDWKVNSSILGWDFLFHSKFGNSLTSIFSCLKWIRLYLSRHIACYLCNWFFADMKENDVHALWENLDRSAIKHRPFSFKLQESLR